MITSAYRSGDIDRRPGWRLTFGGGDFSQERIDALKAAVPAHARSYDPATHEWWIALEYEQDVEAVMPEFGAYQRQMPLF